MTTADRTSETFKMKHFSFGSHNKIILRENGVAGCTSRTVQSKNIFLRRTNQKYTFFKLSDGFQS